ncbi:Ankyrin repeat domain containing protein [Asbolus verrucosus]|uniref:Ankyrin repeat domain containing protein n=1 Tax=Asbolus verrucosus TaxID=1661398 RepID=A0A482WDX7_ASBVE|nr:Ankyrin repeat domain containing protein [Asbolus verrucosus]
MNELQRKYHDENIKVARKDGLLLIRDMAKEVQNMMSFKIEAVRRITESAEQAALTPQTDNGQPFRYYNAKRLNSFGPDGRPVEGTREMMLTPNPHFDHLPVNTSLSTVLIPPNVEEYDAEVINAIQWSEHLDPLFIHNYEDDPSLSWQFFGSATGFLRRYPGNSFAEQDLLHSLKDQNVCSTGIAWPPEDMSTLSTVWQRPRNSRNVYDFRSSAWYVSAATSPKDIVILIDNSGSMSGHKSNLARATTESILNTLGDNDFVNVYKFSDITEETVPCFKDMLVQANNENVRWLKESLATFKSENIANFSAALVTGFEILHKYNRTGQGCQCNQAIMLITDGPPSSYRDIFKIYNFPHHPVRIFTYLVGKDSSSAHEMHWMACANKGYYTRIESFDEINEKVLHYIEVLARPMVMYQTDHPIQWTPAYVGGRADSFLNDKVGQLMTTVTTPVFDRRNHTVRVANLLGVVGTDVSIDQIKKLVPPYKLGVNGYSFIINNNGHVLYHPDLRPLQNNELYEDTLEPQYVSVDLTEVELVENENGPRENHSVLLDLRYDMIQQKEGETELGVKIHYDNVRRVTTRRHKYFYTPIEGTPFSLGLAIPERYGMYELLAEQEIKHSQRNVTDYFKGGNWKVHPEWVYCEYTSGTSGEQWFRTAEERVLHFLSRSRRPGWKWMSLRPRSPSQREHHHQTTKKDKDAYFCDKNLLQSLVLDAMVTEELERHNTRFEDKHQGYQIFGLTLTFVATRSGLLRWTDHTNNTDKQPHFSEKNVKAMDETWYKRAVDQHSVEPESFVFSVPFDSNLNEKPLITATHAVFVEHNGHRAPAAVVGLQYQHSTLASHFLNITSKSAYGTAIAYAQDEGDLVDIFYSDYDNNFEQYPTGEDVIGEQDPIIPPPHTNPPFVPPYESDPMEGVGVRPCDRKVDLYILQPDKLNVSGQSDPLKGKLTNCHVTACERPFSVQKIPHSNLILLVVDTLCPCGSKQFSITPQELIYDTGNGGCLHKPKDSLYRRRPPKCINYHPEESEINICGKASITTASIAILLIISVMHYILAILS